MDDALLAGGTADSIIWPIAMKMKSGISASTMPKRARDCSCPIVANVGVVHALVHVGAGLAFYSVEPVNAFVWSLLLSVPISLALYSALVGFQLEVEFLSGLIIAVVVTAMCVGSLILAYLLGIKVFIPLGWP